MVNLVEAERMLVSPSDSNEATPVPDTWSIFVVVHGRSSFENDTQRLNRLTLLKKLRADPLK
jgi:hypothetical protein